MPDIELNKVVKRPIVKNMEDAIESFIVEWCYKCSLPRIITEGESIENITPLCPPETLETCPFYQKIKLLKSVEAPYDTHNK